MAYGDPEPFELKVWKKRMKLFALWAAIPSVFLGRAALSYYGGPTICFMPLKIVSDQDHIDAAVIAAKTMYIENDERVTSRTKTNISYLKSLDPKTCCKVLRSGRFESESYSTITYYTTLIGMYARIVDLGQKPAIGYYRGDEYTDPERLSDYQKRFRIPMTVCGKRSKEY
jgi:hypothetical protein